MRHLLFILSVSLSPTVFFFLLGMIQQYIELLKLKFYFQTCRVIFVVCQLWDKKKIVKAFFFAIMFSSKILIFLLFNPLVLQAPRALEELRKVMDEDELKTFLTIHIKEGAWQVVLLFMDELPEYELLPDWYHRVWDEEMFPMPLYSSTSGILKAWPTEYDPGLVTLCKAITNKDWKVTRLIFSTSRISDDFMKSRVMYYSKITY